MRILDLFAEDSWRNVYAGELEVRPAFALPLTRRLSAEARSAKVDLRELRPASHQARPPLLGGGLNVVKSSRRRRRA
jgi:hypothetical protein